MAGNDGFSTEIFEVKMVALETGAMHAAAFPSGMSAITTESGRASQWTTRSSGRSSSAPSCTGRTSSYTPPRSLLVFWTWIGDELRAQGWHM
jgi:cystathionine beta-lyase/cystathionine gamma-synthase